jgi:plasmid maintenance system killer protein
MQLQMETFSKELEEALDDEDVKNVHKEFEKSFNDALKALDHAQNSQEAQELRQAIENFYRKLQEELSVSDAPGQKPSF